MAMEYLFLSVRALGPERQASSLRFSTVPNPKIQPDFLSTGNLDSHNLLFPPRIHRMFSWLLLQPRWPVPYKSTDEKREAGGPRGLCFVLFCSTIYSQLDQGWALTSEPPISQAGQWPMTWHKRMSSNQSSSFSTGSRETLTLEIAGGGWEGRSLVV